MSATGPSGARRFAWVLNLDAELELASGGTGYSRSAKLAQQLARYKDGARVLLGPHDVVIDDEPGPSLTSDRAGLAGRAWCPTPSALRLMHAAGVVPEPHPELSVICAANHRRLSSALGAGPPGSVYIEDWSSFTHVIATSNVEWLAKRPLSFAGRGQLYLRGELTLAQRRWVSVSLEHGGFALEPRVRPTLELGLHGYIQRSGSYRLGRPCVQEVSAQGVWKGTRLAKAGELDSSELAALHARGDESASALLQIGYFGPFGIDAYRHEAGFCSLSEINARFTMGFAVGFGVPACALWPE